MKTARVVLRPISIPLAPNVHTRDPGLLLGRIDGKRLVRFPTADIAREIGSFQSQIDATVGILWHDPARGPLRLHGFCA